MKRIKPEVVIPCLVPGCGDEGRGKSQETAEAALRRHLSMAHKITLGYEGKDLAKRGHADLLARRARGERTAIERVISPRGGRRNFDARGAAELLALLVRRPPQQGVR